MNLKEAIYKFREWGIGKYAPRTIETYTFLLNKFLEFIGDKIVKSIIVDDFVVFLNFLKRKHYAESSISYAMLSVRQFWKFLYLQHLVNIDWQIIPIPKAISRSYIPATKEDAEKMLNVINVNDFKTLRDKLIISFLYSSGVRVSELCELRVGDLNLQEQFASIISKKNCKRRMIFWDDETHCLLCLYLDERLKLALDDSLFININRRGKDAFRAISTRSIQRIIKEYREKAGIIKRITPHSFRHGLGMAAIEARIHPRFIQIILGHKNLNSSQVYMDYKNPDVIREYKILCLKRELQGDILSYPQLALDKVFARV